MATYWTGSIDLAAGQMAVVQTYVQAVNTGGFTLNLTFDQPAFDLTCTYDGSRFFCATPDYECLIAAEELDMYPDYPLRYRIKITFKALVDGVTTAQWNILAGNANLLEPSLTAA